jgi:hypothetical protein
MVINPPEQDQQQGGAHHQPDSQSDSLLQGTEPLLQGSACPQGSLEHEQRPHIGRTAPEHQGRQQASDAPAEQTLQGGHRTRVAAGKQQ